ncbi:MAG: hypothetical protein FIA92_01100 [Chloroflexi bacterium]|nr:hypothetical protein [Chloroflexota bacterium]
MRKFLVLVAVLAAMVAACGGQAAVTNDPYELVHRAQSATWERVQVDVGINVSGPETISIDPSAMRFAIDTTAGKANIHVAFPIAALGDAASEIRALGITGDTLDIDVIFDGEALYAKSAALGNVFAALMVQAGEIPSGDMTGWLQLLSKADLESLGSLGGGLSPVPVPDDLPIPSGADVGTIKTSLEEMGITLTYVGTGSRNGVDADHVSVAVDLAKLAESEFVKGMDSGDLDLDPSDGTLSGDLWFERSNGRLIGVDIHAASTTDTTEKADITINLHDPDAGVSFDAPASFVEVPLMELISSFMGGLGGGLLPQ